MSHPSDNFFVEVLPSDDVDFFQMKGGKKIKDAIKNIKTVGGYSFDMVPSWDLRIMEIPSVYQKTHQYLAKYYLQYNVKSGRYRLIIWVTGHMHPPEQAELTMTGDADSERSPLNKENRRGIDMILSLIRDDHFWHNITGLSVQQEVLTNGIKELMSSKPLPGSNIYMKLGTVPREWHDGGSLNNIDDKHTKKYLKYKHKYLSEK